MIDIPRSSQIKRNEEVYGMNDGSACIVCSRPMKEGSTTFVRILFGVSICTDNEAMAEPAADMGFYPIGANCLKNHPELKPYVRVFQAEDWLIKGDDQ